VKDFLNFIFTQVSRITMLVIRFVLKLLNKIPFVDLALYIVADLCYFLLDKVFMTIGTFVCMFKGNGAVGRYWKINAIMLDNKLNVSGQHLLNATMIKGEVPQHLKFGNPFSTVSDQTGRLPKLTGFGYFIKDVFLDTIDKDHCAKAVQLNNKALLKRITELKLYDLN
jgi:hypothetical protein